MVTRKVWYRRSGSDIGSMQYVESLRDLMANLLHMDRGVNLQTQKRPL